MKVGDFVKKKCVRPEYGIIIELQKAPVKKYGGVWIVHWSEPGSYGYPLAEAVWGEDIEVINESR